MKNVFKATLFFAVVILMSSCGGSVVADEGNMVGEWTPNLSKVELDLSDEIPADIRSEIEKGMKDTDEMAEAQKEMDKNLSIQFKEDGKLILGADGESQEMNWKIEGSNLNISGDIQGFPAKLSLEVVESTVDVLTVKLAGVSILEQVESQLKGMMSIDDALDQAKAFSMGQLDGVDLKTAIEESSMQLSFDKK